MHYSFCSVVLWFRLCMFLIYCCRISYIKYSTFLLMISDSFIILKPILNVINLNILKQKLHAVPEFRRQQNDNSMPCRHRIQLKHAKIWSLVHPPKPPELVNSFLSRNKISFHVPRSAPNWKKSTLISLMQSWLFTPTSPSIFNSPPRSLVFSSFFSHHFILKLLHAFSLFLRA